MLKILHQDSKSINICLLLIHKNDVKAWILRRKMPFFVMQKGHLRLVNLSVLSEKWPSNIF